MSDEHSSQKQRILSQISNSLYTAAQKKESSYNRQFWKHKNTVGFHISHFSCYMFSDFNHTTAGHYCSILLVNIVQLKIIKIEYHFQIVLTLPDWQICNSLQFQWSRSKYHNNRKSQQEKMAVFAGVFQSLSLISSNISQSSLFPQIQMKPKIWRTAFFWHDSLKILRSEGASWQRSV